MKWLMGLDSVVRRVVVVATVLLLLLVVGLTVGLCHSRSAVKEERSATTKAEGRTVSAVEAITEIGRLNERGAATDEEVNNAQDAIRQASPADRDAVARYHLCVLHNRTDCKHGVQ